MIRPPGFRGAAFGAAADGDGRSDAAARRRISRSLGLSEAWAYLHQVHGRRVWRASGPGLQGDGDALFTTTPGLPLAVGTADCLPVVLEAADGVGLAHVGWRGAVAGVVAALRGAMEAEGLAPLRAAVGPGIGPCCFAVGPEVAAALPGFEAVARTGAVRSTCRRRWRRPSTAWRCGGRRSARAAAAVITPTAGTGPGGVR